MKKEQPFIPQNPCTLSGPAMYRHNQRQLEFEDFILPFGGKLRSDNRWVKLAKLIPWDEFEHAYCKSFTNSGFHIVNNKYWNRWQTLSDSVQLKI